MIVQELRKIQDRCKGYLPVEELHALSARTGTPLHRLHEVITFFPHFRLEPPPAVEVRVCRDMACHLRNAGRLERNLKAFAAELDGKQVHVEGVSCLGQCDHAPALVINDHVYWDVDEATLRDRIARALADPDSLPHQHADRSPPGWRIDPYNGEPRYEQIRKFVETRDGDAVLKTLEASGLKGMGGAGFPTHRKWAAVRAEAGPTKYVVCNADESEPGTFKDRELMRRAPHLLVEGMALAGLVTGAAHGYVYIRHEFEEEIEAMERAIEAARAAGLCGDRILGSDLSFPLEVFVSPGNYICGEESALLEAMEDRRAEPRNKPPFPVQAGLYGKPTVINNVETLSWVPAILAHGGEWYKSQGVRGATGLRFVSISGDVNQPGVYEVPFGQTVRELIDQAGGMRDGQQLKAIAPSGPSSGFLPAQARREALPPRFVADHMAADASTFDVLDLPLDSATLGKAGSMLGAAFVAYGDKACMVDNALNCTEFFRNESCGKCVPCRLGSQKLTDLLRSIAAGRDGKGGLSAVGELSETMMLTSICGLGQVAANPLTSLMRHFRDELDEHVERGRCPAGVCRAG
ncbi:MAG TPA: NADH-ubiquinone oxidoreductase-F iron-sulfur binding region domain-containing protein [Isosphaeraceae bacterium]|jgi:NADH:ubiquinone oxidoreductase subunit F (NADH-binding)|nr:NADH-ubiquinone oxidoreductase-F iron-sulfur binding region domain-containing protein [Isosphaeraceae bacterium]